MTHDESDDPGRSTFRRTLVKVLVVQVLSLLLLWFLQSHYGAQ